MTDERIREALDTEAAGAPDSDDLWERTTRRIRKRRVQRWASVATVVMLAAAVIGTVTLPALDQPREVVLGEADVPAGWQDVNVADAVVSVPPDWEVVDVTAVTPDEPPVVEDPETGEEIPDAEPDSQPCPAFDPDRPVLVYSERGSPLPCPEDPDQLTGLAVTPLRASLLGISPAVLEAGEPTRVGTVPGRAVAGGLLTGGSEVSAAGDVATYVVPGLAAAVEVHPGPHAEEVEAVLDTLRPSHHFDADGVLHTVSVTEDVPADQRQLVGWAVDADGRFHRWLSDRVDDDATGAAFWPAATGSRFGAVVETGDQPRVVAARPGDDVSTEFPLGPDASLETVAWSPGGEAVAWLVPGTEPRLGLLEWESADALADGAEPTRTDVAVTGLPDVDRHPFSWDIDDRGEHLAVHDRDGGPFRADVPRDAAGRLDLPVPLVFSAE